MIRLVLLLASLTVLGCGQEKGGEVVVYTSYDRNFSEPVLDAFANKTGIKVRAAYDTEANKTIGLVNRLIAERGRPQADVFWNNEVGRTIILKAKGVLAAYRSPGSLNRPEQHVDPDRAERSPGFQAVISLTLVPGCATLHPGYNYYWNSLCSVW